MQKVDREGDIPSFRPAKISSSSGRKDADGKVTNQSDSIFSELGLGMLARDSGTLRKYLYSKEALLDLASKSTEPPSSMAEGLPPEFFSTLALQPLCTSGAPPLLRSVGTLFCSIYRESGREHDIFDPLEF